MIGHASRMVGYNTVVVLTLMTRSVMTASSAQTNDRAEDVTNDALIWSNNPRFAGVGDRQDGA